MSLGKEPSLLRSLGRINSSTQLQDEKLRQRIRESSVEIQELESKLRLAYVGKERAAQIAERKAERIKEVQAEAEYTKYQHEEFEIWKRQRAKEQSVRFARQEEIRKSLVEQISQASSQRLQEDAKVKAEERHLLESVEIEARLKEEKELELEKAKKKFFVNEMAKSVRLQSQWKQIQHLIEEEEDRLIAEIQTKKQNESAFQKEQKRRQIEQLTNVRERLAHALLLEEKTRNERQELLLELQKYENKQKSEEIMIRQKNLEEERYRKWCEQLDSDLKARQLSRNLEREEEEQFRQQLLHEWAARERLDLLSDQRRRRRQVEHRREAEKQLQDRRLAHAQAVQLERQAEELRSKIHRTWDEAVFHERQRILQEHAPLLLGFMPRGLMRDVADIQLLPEELKVNFCLPKPPKQDNPDSW